MAVNSNQTLNQMRNSKVAVVGLGLTGLSAIKYLLRHQIKPDVFDSREHLIMAEDHKDLIGDLNCQLGEFSDNQFNQYDFVIVSPGISLATPALAKALRENDNVFCDVELFARVNQKPVLAVTGSNGKSTVVAWLEHFLNSIGKKAVACGNYGVPVLDVIDEEYDVFVLELSSFQLESTNSLVCEAACVLNVTEDHLDRYESFQHYSDAKNRIYKHAKKCLYNNNDFSTKPLISHDNVESFGSSEVCLDSNCWRYDERTQSLFLNDRELCNFKDFSVAGSHNALNALAVMALLNALDIDLVKHIKNLYSFAGLPHRCQLIATHNDIRFVNDSKATNVGSTEAALVGLATDKNIVLIAGGDAKGADLSELSGLIQSRVKKVVAFGKDAAQFSGFVEQENLTLVIELKDAVNKAISVASSGDIVLLSPACASIDMFKNYQQRGELFKQYVTEFAQGGEL